MYKCPLCKGKGLYICRSYDGSGRYLREDCNYCYGTGEVACPLCKGKGNIG
ncbi:hypothetical protein HRbin04_00668 [archaeon HR04]|nr:hypothetical protein HRbin04_00668 [archaeon HR04]